MLQDPKLEKFKELAKLVNDGLSKQDFLDAFKVVLDYIKSFENKTAKDIEQIRITLEGFAQKLREDTTGDVADLKKEEMDYCMAEMQKMMVENTATMNYMRDWVRNLKQAKDGIDGKDANPADVVPLVLAALPPDVEETPEEVRDKLETLEGDARLDISSIKGVEELVKSTQPTRVQTPAKAYRVHIADCTSQCNGSVTTFTVGGSHFGIIGVFGTQFPQIYRPVIDYTETKTGFTLTAGVTPPATGQTLIAQYLK